MGHGCKAKGGYYIYLCNLTMLKIVPEKEKKKRVNGCANLSKQAHLKKIVYNNGILSGTFLLSQLYNPLHLSTVVIK